MDDMNFQRQENLSVFKPFTEGKSVRLRAGILQPYRGLSIHTIMGGQGPKVNSTLAGLLKVTIAKGKGAQTALLCPLPDSIADKNCLMTSCLSHSDDVGKIFMAFERFYPRVLSRQVCW